MYKPTSSYRMTSQSKRLLSRILNAHDRGEVRRLIVQSELLAENKSRSRNGKEIRVPDAEWSNL